MKGRKQSWVTKIFLLLTLPYLVTVFVNGPEAVAVNKTTDMENILPIILSEQISPEYRIETLEAQAVIARSNLMRKLQEQADTGSILCEISNNIKQKGWVWKIPEKCYETAVKNTQGQILTVDGELKLVPYHEISAGETRDGEEAFHDSQYAYLKSVDSSADKDAAEYLSSTYVSEQQLPKELAISSRDKRGYVQSLTAEDTVLFLLSGGGSALFESPLVPAEEMADVTKQLLACGADIVEMNTLRKRLSAVKGGRFAERCLPAKVFSIVLSDILGDPLDMIASGPAYPDSSTCAQALEVVRKYGLRLSDRALELLAQETPKTLTNVETHITGSVRQLCASAEQTARALGYTPVILTASLRCTARDAGSFLASIAQCHQDSKASLAYIAGGETVVHLTGHGLGGRNQEIALSAAQEIAGLRDTAVFSFGSDGTDGPTDAAGGYCDGDTCAALAAKGISIPDVLQDNDAYHALQACGGLILTGPTGTNVNDLSVLLIRR